jgi:hypothetical protein
MSGETLACGTLFVSATTHLRIVSLAVALGTRARTASRSARPSLLSDQTSLPWICGFSSA